MNRTVFIQKNVRHNPLKCGEIVQELNVYKQFNFFARAFVLALTIAVAPHAAAQTSPTPAGATPARTGLAAFAKGLGFTVCTTEINLLDQNLLRDSEYSSRAFLAETKPNSRPFSAVIDSRKPNAKGGVSRALTNIVVTPTEKEGERCTVQYEQTLFHDLNCDLVRQQMAPNAMPIKGTSFGALILDVSRNMTLTIIPVAAAQCITVLKEVAF